MGFVLFAAFIGVPLIEIALFIQVGDFIGLWPTIAVVVLTAIAGTALLRHQGLATLGRLQNSLDRGEAPIDSVFDGFCLLVAGILLLTPGFFTDALGFLLFTPPLRSALRRVITSRIKVHSHAHSGGGAQFHWHSSGARPPGGGMPGDIIDGDFQDVTDSQSPVKQKPPALDTDPKGPA